MVGGGIAKDLELIASLPDAKRDVLIRFLFTGVRLDPGADPAPYLRYPQLWPFEQSLDVAREQLRQIVVNAFFSTYPAVPSKDRIQKEFLSDDSRFVALVYEWLRQLWLEFEKQHLLDGNSANDSTTQARMEVLANMFLDRQPYLTDDARRFFLRTLATGSTTGNPSRSMFGWMQGLTGSQPLMDQLRRGLLENEYAALWEALSRLSEVQRQAVPFRALTPDKYLTFRQWGRPEIQRGIVIVDMLPASRDDLVAISIREGGVTAQAAAQADFAVAAEAARADMMQMQQEAKQSELERRKQAGSETVKDGDDLPWDVERAASDERLSGLKHLVESSATRQASASARASGGFYARARAAIAYSKRREYLDAVITAAGRGDNFAKWVVRRGGMESDKAGTNASKLVASAHTGYPNGDQPFELLVKIPHEAIRHDWNGHPYVLFNSSYVATGRTSWIKAAGWAAIIPKGAAALVNPRWWSSIERHVVATTFPFKWDIEPGDSKGQADLITDPNFLGARLYLDDTDKVKYSEVQLLVQAEAAFIQATREAQSKNLGQLLNQLDAESKTFRDNFNKEQMEKLQEPAKQMSAEEKRLELEKQRDELDKQIEAARQKSP